MITSSTIVIILCGLSAGLALGLAYKAMRLAKLLEMQISLQQLDIANLVVEDKTLNEDVKRAISLVSELGIDLNITYAATSKILNKRLRKLEQKDGQIQNWVTTSVDCFENQQDQIDTLHNTVFGKPALDKPAGEKKDD